MASEITFDASYKEVSVYTPTCQFRWSVLSGTNTDAPVLEQRWQGSNGESDWRPIPVHVKEQLK